MRLMLGDKEPSLLVNVADDYNKEKFNFTVVNGCWDGVFTNGYITVLGDPSGDATYLDKKSILCDNQDRLRGNYNDVFNNFDDVEYIAPKEYKYKKQDFEDDDIAF